ncbi:hypothetical protein CVIRNUC_007928 [Coccomyxa viridis]|uniref:Pre-mRNA-splicing factor Syf1/CRNKL1-like C-terminal HAT-repeats domain-containing protein n=1 Tax=Coccomyxa viridis TaxID=1274662 RepID=A0AAV1IBL5_9CHLO|nr:hypothetical protein CVIRNUC_007928 [Coccomyxa viridis]
MKLQSSDPTGSMTASVSGRGLDSSHCSAFTGQRPHLRQGRRQRQAHQLCRGVTGDNVRAKAIAITWEDMAELEEYSPGAWSDTDSAAQTRPDIRPASVLPESRAKPLKINRDLLLYRAKILRQRAFRDCNTTDRLEMQQQAEAALRKCLAMDATDARAHVALGKLLVQQRRWEEARAIYEEGSTATGGQNEYVWQAWATLESRCGKIAQARKLFDAALVANRKHAAAWHGWGHMEKRQGNLLKAKDIWMKGIRATREYPNPHLYQSIAILAGEMGYVAEARQWFREGTSALRGKKSHALWHAWAVMEAEKGERSAVRYLFRKGLEVNYRSRYVHLSWARFERDEGNVDNARELFRRGHTLNPQDAPLLQAWAVMEYKEGKIDVARQLFEAGSRADPHHLHIWQAWGVLEHSEGNLKGAREMFQQGVWAQPKGRDVGTVWQAWGVLEAGEGNLELARQLFKCAVKADPSSETTWLTWAKIEEGVGGFQRAAELRSYRMQGINDIMLPSSFGISLSQEPADSPLKAVVSTIKEWFLKVESARGVAQRPAPSYMRFRDDGDEYQEATEEVPSLQEMQRFNTSKLELPEVPPLNAQMLKAKPMSSAWAATRNR